MSFDGFVLVHGGMHGGWCWEDVQPLLDRPSIAVDLPGRGRRPLDAQPVTLARCVDAVIADANEAGFDRFVLVGHSMGGLTITEVANRHPQRVEHLVYVAALAPPPRVSTLELFARDSAPAIADLTSVQPLMERERARFQFASDLDEAAFDRMYERCVDEPIGLFVEGVSGYSPVSATYVYCTRDATVSSALTQQMLSHLQPAQYVELDSDHDVMLSHPSLLADVLNRAVD